MKNKHPHAAVVLVLGLAMAGLHLADLLLWSEADTGFAAAGSVWLRTSVAGGVCAALPARAAGGPACRSAGYQQAAGRLHGAGRCCAAASGVVNGVIYGRYAILYPEVLSRSCPVWAAWADLLLPIFAGALAAELRRAGVQRLRPAAPKLGRSLLAALCRWCFCGGSSGGSSLRPRRSAVCPARCGCSAPPPHCCWLWC